MTFKKRNTPWNKGKSKLVGYSKQSADTKSLKTSQKTGLSCQRKDCLSVKNSQEKATTHGHELCKKTERPDKELFDAAVLNKDDIILPAVLRPNKCRKEALCAGDRPESGESSENVIVKLASLTNLIELSLQHNSIKCKSFAPIVNIVKRMGLCLTVTCRCQNCTFQSTQLDLFDRVKKEQGPGPAAGSVNHGLIMSAMKSKVGASDLSFILATMNIKPPSNKFLYTHINHLCDKTVDLNKQSMLENQRFVAKVRNLKQTDKSVAVETDTSYNNRPQSGFEAATQSFSPMIEMETNKKYVISMAVANKLCPKQNCSHKTDKCMRNYSFEDSIAASESKLAEENLRFIHSSNILEVSSVTSDACTQLGPVLRKHSTVNSRTIEQNFCFIHHLRNFQRNFRKIQFESRVPGGDKHIYMGKLSSAFRMRVHAELVRLKRKKVSKDILISKGNLAVKNIIYCFQNNHSGCKKNSLVCSANKNNSLPSFLPYGRYIDFLSQGDIGKIEVCLQKYFSPLNLQKVCRLQTTNKSESLHHRVFTYAPKNTIWSRNFNGLCHSAVHSSTLGTGKSTIILAATLGIHNKQSDPFHKEMIGRDKRSHYDKNYKLTSKYKTKRYYSRKKRCNRKLIRNSLYQDKNETMTVEHSYAINPLT